MLDKVQKNRVLVTGAAGFIGANLCLKLFEKYADITVSEDGLELEETIENVMEILENQ